MIDTVYDLVLKKKVNIIFNIRLPSGVLAEKDGAKPLVHSKGKTWHFGEFSGELLTEKGDDDTRLRFAQIINNQKKDDDENYIVHTFSLYENISDLDLNEFEKILKEEIPHLESIAANPVLDLKRDEIKLPISRVKRYTSRALPHLSGHSEDWQGRTFSSVVPKRLYALILEDTWATYENRLTRTLCQEMDTALTRRINTGNKVSDSLNQISELYKNRSDYYQKTGERYDKRASSYFNIETREQERANASLRVTIDILKNLRKNIRGFLNSQLCKKINQTQPVSLDNIKLTNLLQHHQHYRYVVVLRNYFLKVIGKSYEKNAEEIEKEQLDLISNITRYVELCIRQIFKEDGYQKQGQSVFIKGAHKIELCVNEKEVIMHLLSFKGIAPLRFISVPCDPKDYYSEKKTTFEGDTVIVYPGNSEGVEFVSKKGSINKIGISPFSIFSEEIIASIIFKWLTISIFKEYPKKREKVPESFRVFIKKNYPDSLDINGSDITILKPIKNLTAEMLKRDFEKFKRTSQWKKDIVQDEVINALIEGSNIASAVSTCFVCGEDKSYSFKTDNNGINLRCDPCNARWGKNNNGKYFFRIEHSGKESFPALGRYENITNN
jgi:hypothetical protein